MIVREMSIPKWIFNLVFSFIVFSAATVWCAENFTLNGKTTSVLNFRQGPGGQYGIIAVIPANTSIKVYENSKNSNWNKVLYKGKQGYVSSKYVTFVEPGKTRGVGKKGKKNKNLTTYIDNYYGYSVNLPKDWKQIKLKKPVDGKISQKRLAFFIPKTNQAALIWVFGTSKSPDNIIQAIYKNEKGQSLSIKKSTQVLGADSKLANFTKGKNKQSTLWCFSLQTRDKGKLFQKGDTNAYLVEIISNSPDVSSTLHHFQESWSLTDSKTKANKVLGSVMGGAKAVQVFYGKHPMSIMLIPIAGVALYLMGFFTLPRFYRSLLLGPYKFKIISLFAILLSLGTIVYIFNYSWEKFAHWKSILLCVIGFTLMLLLMKLFISLIISSKSKQIKRKLEKENSLKAKKAKERLAKYNNIKEKISKENMNKISYFLAKMDNESSSLEESEKTNMINECLNIFPECIHCLFLKYNTDFDSSTAKLLQQYLVALNNKYFLVAISLLYMRSILTEEMENFIKFLDEELAFAVTTNNLFHIEGVYLLKSAHQRALTCKEYQETKNINDFKKGYSEALSMFLNSLIAKNAKKRNKSFDIMKRTASRELKTSSFRKKLIRWFEEAIQITFTVKCFYPGLSSELVTAINGGRQKKNVTKSTGSDTYIEVDDSIVSSMDGLLGRSVMFFFHNEFFQAFGGDFNSASEIIEAGEAIPALADNFDLGTVSDAGSAIGDLLSISIGSDD